MMRNASKTLLFLHIRMRQNDSLVMDGWLNGWRWCEQTLQERSGGDAGGELESQTGGVVVWFT